MHRNNQKILAAAVTAALGLPLAAQAQSSITIYGRLYPQVTHYSSSGASGVGTSTSTLVGPISTSATATAGRANVSGNVMESSNSRMGFRGVEDLGGDLKAIFQLEANVGIDNGSGGPAGIAFNRDTFVGMAGNFGTIRLGKMDTVYKNLGDTLSFLGISSGNFVSISSVLSKAPLGTSSSSSFHLRRDNSVIYTSPEFGGFQALADYSFGEVVNSNRSGAVISAGVKYEQGPIYTALAHERHNDLFGGSRNVLAALSNTTGGTGTPASGATPAVALANSGTALPGVTSTDTATRATVQYKVTPQIRVEGNVARLDYREKGGAAGKFSNFRTTTWSIGTDYKVDAYNFAVSYARAAAGSCSLVGGANCSTQGLQGKMVNAGVGYSLSKRTMLYLIGSRLINDSSARFSNVGDAPRPAVGQDITQVALGIRHDF